MILKKILRRLMMTLSAAFACISILCVLASLFGMDQNPYFIPLVYFPKTLLLGGTVFFLVIHLFLKNLPALLFQSLNFCFLLFFHLISASFGSPQTPPGDSWLLMSVNTDKCRKDLTILAREVKKRSPDFLCLQEVPGRVTKEVLEYHFPSFSWCKKKYFAIGCVFPLQCGKNLSFKKERFALIARCRLKGKTFKLASVHLKQPGNFGIDTLLDFRELRYKIRLHLKGAARLRSWAKRKNKPVILIGDFNAPTESAVMRRFALADAFSEAGSGLGLSWPSVFPLISIDHCLHNPDITVFRCETIPLSGFSDHRGLLVRWGFNTVQTESSERRIISRKSSGCP